MKEEPIFSPTEHIIKNFNGYTADKVIGSYLPSEGFCLRYEPTNQFIAIGCNNGTKILWSVKEQKIVASVDCPNEEPVTCAKWRPTVETKTRVLGFTNAAGFFDYYHIPTMKKLFSIQQAQNSLHCCDFDPTGEHFATAGRDAHIRVYDQNTKSVTTDLGCAEWNYRGHANRIFSVKFIDSNTIVSGGWDSVIHLWDIRAGKSQKAVFGPHVAGDSIDYSDGQLLIGCYASKNQIQVWDFNKFTVRQSISWNSSQDKEKVAYVYTAGFGNKDKKSIVAGACGVNEVKIYHWLDGAYRPGTLIHNIGHGCFSIDSSHCTNQFSFSTAHDGFFTYRQGKEQ